MYFSRFNYVSDYEKDGQRLLMNFLSRSCDIVDEESASTFLEKKALSADEKEYAARRGYLFQNEADELVILQELYKSELQHRPLTVVHLDTFSEKRKLEEVSEKIRNQKESQSLILYSENLLDDLPLDHFVADCSVKGTRVVTTYENLSHFKSLFMKNAVSQVTLTVPASKDFPFAEDTESLLDTLVEQGTSVKIVVRIEKNDAKRVKPLMNYFISKGWPFLENFTCDLEPNPNEGCIFGHWYCKTGVDLARTVFREYKTHPQTEFCSMQKWVGINPIHSLIWTGKPSHPSSHFCEASKGLKVFTDKGQVPCLNLTRSDREFQTERMKECEECVYALTCGGGCSLKVGKRCPPVKELIEVSLEHYFEEFLQRLRFYQQRQEGIQ